MSLLEKIILVGVMLLVAAAITVVAVVTGVMALLEIIEYGN